MCNPTTLCDMKLGGVWMGHIMDDNLDDFLRLMKSKEIGKIGDNWWINLKGNRGKHLLSFSMFFLFCLLVSKFLATKYLQGLLVFWMVVSYVETPQLVMVNTCNFGLFWCKSMEGQWGDWKVKEIHGRRWKHGLQLEDKYVFTLLGV
jgi:hypothetical protein